TRPGRDLRGTRTALQLGTLIDAMTPRDAFDLVAATLWGRDLLRAGRTPPLSSPVVRVRGGRLLLGVCAGIGQALGLNRWLVRILFTACAGYGAAAYAVLALLIPAQDMGRVPARVRTAAMALVIVGIGVLA